jgi:nucleoside-diphosphate-sugar epimerase
MVLAEDVAKAIVQIAKFGGIYNLTDGCHPSFAELSKHICLQMGKNEPLNIPVSLAKWIAKIGDFFGKRSPINTYKLTKLISDRTFDDSKARKAFGWNPTPVLKGFKINDNNV